MGPPDGGRLVTGKPLGLEAVADIPDPLERAREAERLAAYAEDTARRARQIRDAAIVEAHAGGGVTRPGIADHVGVTKSVVVAALRKR